MFLKFFIILAICLISVTPTPNGSTPTPNGSTPPPKSTTMATTTIPSTIPPPGNSSISATIYTMAHFHGVWWTLDVTQGCQNLPSLLAEKASSIDTHGSCVRLHDKEGCQGKSVIVAPGTRGHSDLSMVDFDNRLVSLGPCDKVQTATGSSSRQELDQGASTPKPGANITLNHIIY